VSALALIAAFFATYLLFERTYFGQLVEERAFSGAAIHHSILFRAAGLLLGTLPVIAVGGSAVIVGTVALVTRRYAHLVVAVIVGGVAFAFAEVAKHLLLTRAETAATGALTNTFPSGHTTTAAAAAFAVFVVATPRFRLLAGVLGGAVATLVGLATLVQQWHRPSDIVGALLLVAACGCLGGAALSRRARHPEESARSVTPLWWLGAVSAAVSLAAFLTLWAAPGAHLQIAFVGGSTAILATAALLTAGGVRIFGRIA
jgi:membrane-associated phospholipid phosphatase